MGEGFPAGAGGAQFHFTGFSNPEEIFKQFFGGTFFKWKFKKCIIF
jgi:hypothetical protein